MGCIIDGTAIAKRSLQKLFEKAKQDGLIPEDVPFDPREIPLTSTAIRLVAVDTAGVPYPGIHADGVRLITDSTRVRPLDVQPKALSI